MISFADRIKAEVLASHPDWDTFATYETFQGSAPYLVVTVPAPPEANAARPLRISTYDEEITVDFDHYHTHFERWNPRAKDGMHDSAMLYLRELLNERVAVASWWQGDLCKLCSQYQPGSKLKPTFAIPFTRIRVRSWRGSHNADIDA